MKKTALLFVLLLSLGLCGCDITAQPGNTEPPRGKPDKTGSWGHINQVLTRPENWKQIVKNSQFQLGERELEGSWQQPDGKVDYYKGGFGTYPCIDGSTVCVPMAVEFSRQHLKLSDEDAMSFVVFNTTNYAYENLINKTTAYCGQIRSTLTFLEEKPVDIIFVTEPSDDELALAREKNVQLVVKPVCYDAFVFIVHKDNPVNSLTIEQIQKIYSGEITNWKQVGGPDREIKPYQRDENSGSQTTMQKRVMQGKKMIAPNKVNVVVGMGELVETVGEYENSLSSIGYSFKYYLDTLYKSDKVKAIQVEGVYPSNDKIQNGSYPYTTNYFGVIRSADQENVGGKFLDWMLTDEGQDCIKQAGYCPIKAR